MRRAARPRRASSCPATGATASSAAAIERACAGRGARDQGGLRRPQRDLDRRDQRHRRGARAIDRAGHPALLMVDTISSLASIDYRHDEWGVDVTVGGSQKGLMLPPGLSFNAISAKALAASQDGEAAALLLGLGRDARDERQRLFPVHAGHQSALRLARGAGHAAARKASTTCSRATTRQAEATRRAVRAWGLEVLCGDPAEYSASLTAVMMPDGHDADALRRVIHERFDLSLGTRPRASSRGRCSASATSATSTT